jgi:hypothetical protein
MLVYPKAFPVSRWLSRLGVKHAENSSRSVKDRVIMHKQPLPRPLNLSSSGMKNWITHIMKWQLQVVKWKYKGENKHLKNYKQPDVFYNVLKILNYLFSVTITRINVFVLLIL